MDRLRNWADRKADLPPQEALEFAERNLDRQIRIYGPDGGPTAVGRWNVATKLEALGRYEEARLLRREVIAAYGRHVGAEHPHTLSAELALGINLAKSGLCDDARTLFEHVLEHGRRVLPPDDETTKTASRWLASLDRGKGTSEEK